MKNKFLYVVIFIFFLPFISSADHIVGGSMTYEQLGGSTYRITLALYRDCNSATDFSSVKINIVKSNGAPFKVISIAKPVATLVPPKIDSCVANPGICLQEAIYSQVVTGLPPSQGGYHVYYQTCCRTDGIINILNSKQTGESYYAHIPDNSVVTSNSSPNWISGPQSFICQGNAVSIDNGASDADGDSLYYSLFTPYDSRDTVTFPGGVFTTSSLIWASTYGANNPLNASIPNSLQINSKGLITGSPPLISGNFVIGVRCQEYRNGIRLGEILRDFQLKVVPCPPKLLASYNYSGNCVGMNVSFNTLTVGATSYHWDFGNKATLADTSRLKNPSYTFPKVGKYAVRLIINKGTPCADTSIQTVHVTLLNAAFNSSAPACQKTTINFTDLSTVDTSNTLTNWSWNFGDSFTSSLKNPKHAYSNSGNYNVTLIVSGASCKDTVSNAVSIQAMPDANAGNDTTRCANNPAVTLKGKISNASGGTWKGSGTFVPNNNVLNPVYTATSNAIKNGKDTLLLISTGNALCPADTDMVVITFTTAPSVNAGKDVIVCKDTASVPLCATVSIASGVWWKSMGNGKFMADSTKLCTSYKPSKADTTAGSVILYVTTSGNGNCTAVSDSMRITFTSTIKATITSRDTACAGSPVPINVNVTTNSGVWTSSGTGIFKPSSTTLNGFYIPSKTDSINGKVKLIFTSTNNGICLMQKDTLDVSIIPSPSADFSTTSVCAGKPALFTDKSLPVNGIAQWKWDFGDASSISMMKNPAHTYLQGGSYPVKLIVISNNGCSDTTQKNFVVYHNPVANYTSSGICLKDGIQFLDSSFVTASNVVKWNWYFGDNKTDSVKNPIHHFPSAGTYTNVLVVKTPEGCIDSVEKKLTIAKGPQSDFSRNVDFANVKQSVQFTDLSISAVAWLWNFGDGAADSTSTLQHPVHAYLKTGHYTVCLFATDKNGCMDTLCKTEIVSLPVGVPNAFSPNADGQNDSFMIYGGPFKKVQLKIYNNWGDLIFESDKQSEGWDGRMKGVDQPAGVYVYTIYCVSEDDQEHKLSGDVTLLR